MCYVSSVYVRVRKRCSCLRAYGRILEHILTCIQLTTDGVVCSYNVHVNIHVQREAETAIGPATETETDKDRGED